MELGVILLIPTAIAIACLSPLGRRIAAPLTVAGAAIVFALCVNLALCSPSVQRTESLDGWLSCDALGALILLLVGFVSLTASIYSWGYIPSRIPGRDPLREQRYYVLFNLFVLSMLAVPLLANVALMWIAVELTTLVSAFLVGFEDSPEALEAAWKYVILTTLGAVLALLGFLLLYLGSQIAGYQPFTWPGLARAAPNMPPALIWPAFLLILTGFGVKVGLVPMHTWLPDAHSQAPASICALLSGVETTTVLYVILRLFPVVGVSQGLDAKPWFIAFGLVSAAVATLLLIHVRDFKRMFAFSTIEHMGIILVAAGLGGAGAHLGAAYQMAGHSIAKSFCFFAAGVAATAAGTQDIASVRGLAKTAPLAATVLVLGGFAIAGAPPFALFVSEFTILKAGLASGQFWVVGALAFLVATAFCAIMAHVNRMAFGAPALSRAPVLAIPLSCKLSLLVAAAPMVVVGVFVPGPLADLLRAASAAMGG